MLTHARNTIPLPINKSIRHSSLTVEYNVLVIPSPLTLCLGSPNSPVLNASPPMIVSPRLFVPSAAVLPYDYVGRDVGVMVMLCTYVYVVSAPLA